MVMSSNIEAVLYVLLHVGACVRKHVKYSSSEAKNG